MTRVSLINSLMAPGHFWGDQTVSGGGYLVELQMFQHFMMCFGPQVSNDLSLFCHRKSFQQKTQLKIYNMLRNACECV